MSSQHESSPRDSIFKALELVIQKLQAQIFIFVVGYILLLILVSLLGQALIAQLKALFYMLPLFAMVGYIILQVYNMHRSGQVLESGNPKAAPEEAPEPAAQSHDQLQPIPTLNLCFMNREDEMDGILSPYYAPAYHLLDAPAGYGKTWFLRKLKDRFEAEKWECAYGSTSKSKHGSLPELVDDLATGLNIKAPLNGDAGQMGTGFAKALTEERLSDITRKGVVLLIDYDKKPMPSILGALLEGFIPQVRNGLCAYPFFKQKDNHFRVVVAGRYLKGEKAVQDTRLPLTVQRLTPFNYKVIQDTTRECFPELDRDELVQLSAHVMHLTGGHPGCVTHALGLYKQKGGGADDFAQAWGEEIWKDSVRQVASDIREGVPEGLRANFDVISVFRHLDYAILRALITGKAPILNYARDQFDLADELTFTHLLEHKDRTLQDDITRRLVSIRLRKEVGQQQFQSLCQQAQSIYAKQLQSSKNLVPQVMAIEYLFQSLQQHTGVIESAQERAKIRKSFYDMEVPKMLHLLLSGRDSRAEKQPLMQALHEDWEFRFTVNYFLRQDQYSDEPFDKIKEQLESGLETYRKAAEKEQNDD